MFKKGDKVIFVDAREGSPEGPLTEETYDKIKFLNRTGIIKNIKEHYLCVDLGTRVVEHYKWRYKLGSTKKQYPIP